MKNSTSFFGMTIGIFLKSANKKEAVLISLSLMKEGVKVLFFFNKKKDKKELKKFLYEANSKTKLYAVIFDEDITDAESLEVMHGCEFLTVAMSFPKDHDPVVVTDKDPLDFFLRDIFCKQEVKV